MGLLNSLLPFENGPPDGRRTKAGQSLIDLFITWDKARLKYRWWSIRAVAIMTQFVMFGERLAPASLFDIWFVSIMCGLLFACLSCLGSSFQCDRTELREYCSNLNFVN